MPYFPVYDIDYNPIEHTIIAATFARGIMTFPADELEIETSVNVPTALSLATLSIYPTITSDFVYLEMKDVETLTWPMSFSIIDESGVVMKSKMLNQSPRQTIQFGSDVPSGLYFILIQSGTMKTVRQIIIQGVN